MKRRAEIRRRVKRHISKRGSGRFHLTEAFCMYWWRQLNEAVFDGKLTPPHKFELRRFRKENGWCEPFAIRRKQRRVKIGINTAIANRKAFLEVLGHEMVHQWEWEIDQDWDDRKGDHGPNFFRWRAALYERAGLTLRRQYDIG